MGIVDEYGDLTTAYKLLYGDMTLVLMEVGAFMEFYDFKDGNGADVKRVCNVIGVEANTDFTIGGFPKAMMKTYVPMLLQRGWTVVTTSVASSPDRHTVNDIIRPEDAEAFQARTISTYTDGVRTARSGNAIVPM
jgi:hypothetical protein